MRAPVSQNFVKWSTDSARICANEPTRVIRPLNSVTSPRAVFKTNSPLSRFWYASATRWSAGNFQTKPAGPSTSASAHGFAFSNPTASNASFADGNSMQ